VSEQANVTIAKVTAGGAPLPDDYQNNLRRVEVDLSIHLPGMATLEFYDPNLRLVSDTTGLTIGKEIEIKIESDEVAATSVFKGHILALEPIFEQGKSYCTFTVRAYDKMHWMHRGRKSETYQQVKDSDLVRKIAGENGLSPKVDATTDVHEQVLRDNMSDFEFLKYLGHRNGFVSYIEDGNELHFKSPSSLGTPTIPAEYGITILQFRPTVSLSGQVNEVEVRGWDRKQKQVVVGTSSKATFSPVSIGISERGYDLAQRSMNGVRAFSTVESLHTAGAVQTSANAIHNRVASEDVTAEGVLLGNPKLKPGAKLQLSAISSRFDGSYFVTRVRHRIEQQEGYQTDFWAGGMNTGTLADLISDRHRNPVEARTPQLGLMIGLVTNVADPEAMHRAKVKFPTLSEQLESFWMPVMGIGAGKERGISVLPEVGDEVIVAFENGDIQRGYILGGLWNPKDKAPTPQGGTGQTEIREWKTRIGHVIRFTDSSGGEKIEIIDKTTKNSMVIDSANNTITILADKDIILKAPMGNISLEANNIKMKATAGLEASGATGKVEASSQLELKGAITELTASGMAKISGKMVMIN